MFRIGVFAIIWDEQQRVLLCHRRDHDLWNLPGGRLEAGEAPWQGVIREVKEETGLEVEVTRLAGVYSKPEVDEVVFSFACAVAGGEATTSEEADRLAFFAANALPRNTVPKQVERIHTMPWRTRIGWSWLCNAANQPWTCCRRAGCRSISPPASSSQRPVSRTHPRPYSPDPIPYTVCPSTPHTLPVPRLTSARPAGRGRRA